ncbi:hypothetical protein B1R27_34345 [Streptomyces sp. GKU 895]|nr:hypothetical protein B1R27_34345 [Streptomyces sp. GKU 895]
MFGEVQVEPGLRVQRQLSVRGRGSRSYALGGWSVQRRAGVFRVPIVSKRAVARVRAAAAGRGALGLVRGGQGQCGSGLDQALAGSGPRDRLGRVQGAGRVAAPAGSPRRPRGPGA